MSYEEIWKKAAKEVAKERDCLNDKLNQAYEDGYQMEGKYRDMKTQRDTLIDDIAVLRVNNERLERENEKLRNESIKNYKLWEESEEQERYFVKEFNKYYNLYTTLTNHIHLKAENNPGVSRYIDLVNYIDRLERN